MKIKLLLLVLILTISNCIYSQTSFNCGTKHMFPNDTLARRGGTAARVYGNINDWAVIPPCAAVTIRVAFHVVLNSTGTSGGFRNPAIQGFILNALNTTFNVYNIHFIPNPASPNIDYINDDYYFHFPYGSVNFILSKPSGISW